MRLSALPTIIIFAALVTLPAAADEFTYSLNVDHCTGGCGTAPFGTIDVKAIGGGVDGAGEVQITVNLSAGDKFVDTGFGGALGFNLPSSFSSVTLSNLTSGFATNGSQSAGSHGFDGLGDFDYVVTCPTCGGGSNPMAGPLTFDVTASGLLAASFAQLSTTPPGDTPSYFAADIQGTTGRTGPVGANGPGTPVSSVPEPYSFVLLGTVLLGSLVLLR